ncbi:alkaline phosphatase [Tunicatimonas pelagia]|uniref:alkaline phosphatase n=1 Tax=Tunicatimonas pelagia TaxID=931531 RepID=UPI002665D8CB|nr:alkaline phosphatase [Tunicatimonas pelagia]WKN41005.1 alkaline phosphatase [Tunicatimonas pelagia]
MIRAIIFSFSLLLLAQCQSQEAKVAATSEEEPTPPKNIILLIGDGMGVTQVTSRFYYGEGEPNFQRFPYIGLIKTSSSRQKITDSAAGATAFSAGVKTYNGAIAVADDTTSVPTIAELVADDLSTGLIATSSIVHATPASFYAHVPARSQYEEIAAQLTTSSVDFFAGGGIQFFIDREDDTNYLDSLTVNGFMIDTAQLQKPASFSMEQKYGFLLAPDGMPKMQEGRGNFLPQATQMALDYLSQDDDGFFLMVEGSQIDWGGHANDAEYIIEEVKDFDKTLGVALDFAERDGNTLVVVTADHETGGFALSSDGSYNDIIGTFSTGGHTPDLIPVFAYGPGAESFAGIYENTGIYDKMVEATGWKSLDSPVASR